MTGEADLMWYYLGTEVRNLNRAEYLLSVLAEECCEVAQRATKAQRFGLREIQPDQPFNNAGFFPSKETLRCGYADPACIALNRSDAVGELVDVADLALVDLLRTHIQTCGRCAGGPPKVPQRRAFSRED